MGAGGEEGASRVGMCGAMSILMALAWALARPMAARL